MTVVEFYDRSQVKNVAGLLALEPEQVLFVGKRTSLQRFAPAFTHFAAARGLKTRARYFALSGQGLERRIRVMERIVREEPECVFDLTGGDELTMVAVGVVLERCGEKKPRLFYARQTEGTLREADGTVRSVPIPRLNIEETILLYGGAVRQEKEEYGTHSWILDQAFTAAVDKLWAICRRDPRSWNRQLAQLLHVAQREPDEPCRVTARLSLLEEEAHASLTAFLEELARAGAIERLRRLGRDVSFTYRDEQVARCLDKAGTILELKTLITAKALHGSDGEALYHDAASGVWIDWDGEFHPRQSAEKDTENEVDVVLMHNATPIFISCKNGTVADGELYKLHTVAKRFGGDCARAAILVTDTGKDARSMDYFRRRTRDMHIQLIEDVHKMAQAQFQAALRRLSEA